ncbi:unnamed protein product, partial [Rotaria sp. Silwood1]
MSKKIREHFENAIKNISSISWNARYEKISSLEIAL